MEIFNLVHKNCCNYRKSLSKFFLPVLPVWYVIVGLTMNIFINFVHSTEVNLDKHSIRNKVPETNDFLKNSDKLRFDNFVVYRSDRNVKSVEE